MANTDVALLKEYLALKDKLLPLHGQLMKTKYADIIKGDFKSKVKSGGVKKVKKTKKTKKGQGEKKNKNKTKKNGEGEKKNTSPSIVVESLALKQ
jgi:hypothetical protein